MLIPNKEFHNSSRLVGKDLYRLLDQKTFDISPSIFEYIFLNTK